MKIKRDSRKVRPGQIDGDKGSDPEWCSALATPTESNRRLGQLAADRIGPIPIANWQNTRYPTVTALVHDQSQECYCNGMG